MERIGLYHEQLVNHLGEARATQLVLELAEQHLAEDTLPG